MQITADGDSDIRIRVALPRRRYCSGLQSRPGARISRPEIRADSATLAAVTSCRDGRGAAGEH